MDLGENTPGIDFALQKFVAPAPVPNQWDAVISLSVALHCEAMI